MNTTSFPLVTSLPARARRRAIDADAALTATLVLLLAAAPPLLTIIGAPFWADVLNRIMIMALAATSLSLLIGLAGLVSFGHAVYLGLGGYAVGIAAFHGIGNGFVHLGLAIGLSGLFALLSGFVVLRTRGINFIMITMALAQMIYFVMIGLKEYGGDDGLTIDSRSVFPSILDLEDRVVFYYATLAVLVLTLLFVARLKASRFGLVLAAAKGSERRVSAVGFDPYRYRLVAYVIAGMIAGLSGFLNANFTNFVTPEMMGWTRSGEIMFMAVLGGVGTLAGPIVGAAAFLLIEEVLGSFTIYWHFWFGLFLVGVVLLARGGIVGFLLRRER